MKSKPKVYKYTLIDEWLINCSLKHQFDVWDVYNYLSDFKVENKIVDLYIPYWLYYYIKDTTLPGYQETVLSALRSYFRIYGILNEESANELLVVGF